MSLRDDGKVHPILTSLFFHGYSLIHRPFTVDIYGPINDESSASLLSEFPVALR